MIGCGDGDERECRNVVAMNTVSGGQEGGSVNRRCCVVAIAFRLVDLQSVWGHGYHQIDYVPHSAGNEERGYFSICLGHAPSRSGDTARWRNLLFAHAGRVFTMLYHQVFLQVAEAAGCWVLFTTSFAGILRRFF